MANKYPYIGHSIDQTTMHNGNNQLVTPPSSPSNPAHCSDKKSRVLSSLKATVSLCMLLLLFVLLPNIGWGQDCAYTTATIGSGTDNRNFTQAPVNNYYNYGYRQIIYDASELCGDGVSCVIHKIAFHYRGSYTMYEKDDVRIYMAEVDRAAFTGNNNWEVFANFTEVYRGSLNCDGNSGWNWFTLNRSFNFSGNKHLIVAIWDNSGGYDANDENNQQLNRYGFYWTASDGYKMISAQQDNAPVNRNNPTGGQRYQRRPNTKFCVDCCSNSYSMSSTPLCFDFSDYAYPSAYGNVYSGLPACWSTIYNGQEVVDDDNDHVSGRGHIYSESARLIGMWAGYFDGYVQVNYGRYGYVILPSISGVTAGDVVSFDAFMTSNTNGTLTVGYMSDRNNANTFTVFYTAQNYTSQHSYECTIPAGWNNNSVLAFRWEYNSNTDAAGVFVDNICIIHVVEPGNDCEISYNLADSYGDGWNGNAINVVDLTTGTDLATWTIGSGSSASGTLTVTDGHVLQFSWVSGSYSYECSYAVVAADGTRILEGSNAMNPTTQTYTVSCPTCLRPSDLTGSISGNTATISWTENSGATSWIVEYSTNSDFANATSVNVNTNPATITIPGIVSATPYYFQVKSNCGGEQSSWSEEIYLCVPPSNISCATATTLSCGASLNGTTFCTPGTAHGIPGVTISNYGVWYTFVGDGNLTTISSTAASGFYHEMDIMSGSCGNYTLITDQDLSYNGGTETFTFLTENGVNYYVYIASTYTDATTGTFTISRTCEEYVCNSSNTITLNSTQTVNIGCGTSYCFFDSGGLDGTYSNNEDYTLTLTSTGVIHIKFKTDLIGESGWDTMSIRGTTTEVIRSSSIPAGTEYVASTQGGAVTIHWKSDNSYFYAGWYAIITAEDCCTERDGHLNITSDPACPASIPYGMTLQLTGSVESGYGAGDASWSSSDAGVATVSGGGLVTPVSLGSTTITYTREYDGAYCEATTTCTVNITVPTPTITQTDDPLPQCDIEDAILVASVPTGTAVPPGYTYHWYTNSTCAAETEITSGVSGTNNNTLRYPAASATQVWCRLEKRSTTTTFNYTGNVQTFTVPTGTIMLTMEAWGAQGGNADTRFSGGLGGYSVGTLSSPTGTLYVCVGGVGTTDDGSYSSYTSMPGGYNGGGAGRAWEDTYHGGGGGGGATHIATATGTLASLSANTNSVLIVAGGGGGASDNGNGGSGGGTSGGSGNGNNGCAPGTQTTGSAWGYATGCTYTNGECGGGGGGWYGGYSATEENYAGGGGSGYLKSTLTDAYMENGIREGNGQARIKAILPNGNTIDSTSLAGNITILCCGINATIEFGD